MITILHGENIVASRNRLLELRQKAEGKEIVTLPANVDITMFKQAAESTSLFGDDRLIIIEQLLTKIGRKTSDEALRYLTSSTFDASCILWETKTIPPSILSLFPPKTVVEQFKFNKTLFQFLDNLKPQNTRSILTLYHACLDEEEPELIFAMIIRQVRLLLGILTQAENLEELKRLAPWQRGKLVKQASLFSTEQLITFHNQLHKLDYQVKTGQTGFSLADNLDFLLGEL